MTLASSRNLVLAAQSDYVLAEEDDSGPGVWREIQRWYDTEEEVVMLHYVYVDVGAWPDDVLSCFGADCEVYYVKREG